MEEALDPAITGIAPGDNLILPIGWRANGDPIWVIAGGSESDPSSTDGDSTEGDADASDDAGDDDSGTTDDDSSGGKSFSQKEVNDLVTKEVKRKLRGKVSLQDLGFDSKEKLQEALQAASAAADEKKTEQEKAVETAREEARTAARNEVLPVVQDRITYAEFIVAAKEHGVSVPGDAFVLAQTLDLWDSVEYDSEDHTVSGFDEGFFKSLKEAKPFLFAEEGDDSNGSRGSAGVKAGGKRVDAKKAKDEEVRKRYPILARQGRAR